MTLRTKTLLTALGFLFFESLHASVPKDLEYPNGKLDADELARQVYFVNHFYAFSELTIDFHPKGIAIIVNIAPGTRPRSRTIERHLNNSYQDGVIKSKEIAIVRDGKDKSTGMLIVEYEDPMRPHDHYIWLPQLRKVKRFSQPAYAESWAGTHFTYGDLTLRKPEHESHEIIGVAKFNQCLGSLGSQNIDTALAARLPSPSCMARDRDVYQLKSHQKESPWWYDYRISYVDKITFADYRTEYFKDGKKIKVIDRDWRSLNLQDPRAQYWAYTYVKDLRNQHESEIIVPKSALKYNREKSAGFWTQQTLRQLAR